MQHDYDYQEEEEDGAHDGTQDIKVIKGFSAVYNDGADIDTGEPDLVRALSDAVSTDNGPADQPGPFEPLEPTPLPVSPPTFEENPPLLEAHPADTDGQALFASAIKAVTSPDAPVAFSAEDERKELQSLTVQEMIEVNRDVQGLTADMQTLAIDKSSITCATGASVLSPRGRDGSPGLSGEDMPVATAGDIEKFDEEMVRIPIASQAAYLEACLKCPHVLTKEFKASFMEAENLDAKMATRRMALYWSMRYDIFGPSRCFLPMTLSDAMAPDVADMIKYCPYRIIPRTDRSKRAILFFQPGKRNLKKFPPEAEVRNVFYLITKLSEDPDLRRTGFVFLVDGRSEVVSFKVAQRMHVLFRTAMPIQMRAAHMVYPSKVMQYVLFPMLKGLFPRQSRLRLRLHAGDNRNQILADLESVGLGKERLPRELGGYVDSDFGQWIGNMSIQETMGKMKEQLEEIEEQESARKKRRSDPSSSTVETTISTSH